MNGIALILILLVLAFVAFLKGDGTQFLAGAGLAALFVIFVVPNVHALS